MTLIERLEHQMEDEEKFSGYVERRDPLHLVKFLANIAFSPLELLSFPFVSFPFLPLLIFSVSVRAPFLSPEA